MNANREEFPQFMHDQEAQRLDPNRGDLTQSPKEKDEELFGGFIGIANSRTAMSY